MQNVDSTSAERDHHDSSDLEDNAMEKDSNMTVGEEEMEKDITSAVLASCFDDSTIIPDDIPEQKSMNQNDVFNFEFKNLEISNDTENVPTASNDDDDDDLPDISAIDTFDGHGGNNIDEDSVSFIVLSPLSTKST